MTDSAVPRPSPGGHPPWLKVRAPLGGSVHNVQKLVADLELNTVCQEARCPNMGECWQHGVATFMILGDICTRGCRYCAVSKGTPLRLDEEEPFRVAEAVSRMGLRHAVITSVDRDDLADGGASVFAATVAATRRRVPDCTIEVLIPDFQGSISALKVVLDAGPEILNHNVETVPRLYPAARGGGDYGVSLQLLERSRNIAPHIVTKTGMMLGLGETDEETLAVLRDLITAGVSILTIGQYLRPSGWHLPVDRYYHPDEFKAWKAIGEKLGFAHVEAGPLVRSSYLADRQFESLRRSTSRISRHANEGI